jgi:hypothetical protein
VFTACQYRRDEGWSDWRLEAWHETRFNFQILILALTLLAMIDYLEKF